MRWCFLSILLVIASCANGRILGDRPINDKSAAFLNGPPARIRPLYGNREVWTNVSSGLWLTEGLYVISEECFFITDADQPEMEIHIKAGHRYSIVCSGPYKADMVLKDDGEIN